MSHRYPQYPAAGQPNNEGSPQFQDDNPESVEHFFDDQEPVQSKRKSLKTKQRRRRTIIMLVVVALFVGVVVALALMLRNFLGTGEVEDYPGPGQGSVVFEVPQGAGLIAIGNSLDEQDIVANSGEFISAFQNVAAGRSIQPGEYELSYQMSSEGAASALLDVEAARVHYAAVPRGLRQGEVFDILAESTGIDRAEFEALAEDPTQFGIPEQAPSLEGYLYPGEYRFEIGLSAAEVVQEMVDNTMAELEAAGVTDPAEQYRVLTIASIIAAEAGEADYAAVSGAIMNRLQEDNEETYGLIQSDATVTYGLGRRSYNFTEEERQDSSNPYNTFANPGLPIGPIGSPSEEAIVAAVNPADVPYYYWVTVNLDTGETKFSETLAEHNRYVAEYNAWCADNPGRCA